jgi:hypothetical protein
VTPVPIDTPKITPAHEIPTIVVADMVETAPAVDPAATALAVPLLTTMETASWTPYYYRDIVPCGIQLPLINDGAMPQVTSLSPDSADVDTLLVLAPQEAHPALEWILQEPGTVGLAAYQVGAENEGVFLNADTSMPLASVVKVIHLIAYAEAIAAGELVATETVPIADLERFYQPTLDLRAHTDAIEEMTFDGTIFGQPQALLLDGVARMMIEYSSNAATDYLHMRLGQQEIEATARTLELEKQSAPCPFAGQFLTMANHLRPQISGDVAFEAYLAQPELYGEEVIQLTVAFSEDSAFHEEAVAWRRETRRPRGTTQRLFSEQFNAQGTARSYAGLMARLAQNDLSSPESSFIVRRHLEWPMRYLENQTLFSNLGYKGGSLPGILTTVYYAYPLGETNPVVVSLFYRELPGTQYRQWRRTQAHDELARWLLYDPQAMPAVRALLRSSEISQ